ncbi:MAG: hypothetical protein WGN25_13680 [Candidatus Electrothrix sp. GW3-4]|uniref:hypothetical protein n=1 Tax=Candidatus Electrothrix sp. GW3-4 TaxID=3126740 RepID=UPI0030D62925
MVLSFKSRLLLVFLFFLVHLFWAFPGIAQNEPGTVELFAPVPSTVERSLADIDNISMPEMSYDQSSAAKSSSTKLQPVVSETGFITLSVDGLGVATNIEGSIQVSKPAGATVRGAYLATADVWGLSGTPLPDGAVVLNDVNVGWEYQVSLDTDVFGPLRWGIDHAWADVTPIIAPLVDAAPAGIINITLKEIINLDGSILAVIFDDPNQTVSNTVVLFFGAQQTSGDTFHIGLSEPVNTSDPNLFMEFSLGISYGYQSDIYRYQFSEVDVNNIRLTSSAGGQDDGYADNGGLITVGGIGDSPANPVNPYAGPVNQRTDDELYDLLPYVSDGDTGITIDTFNPSNDDSIFFAALFFGSTTAVVGEGIILSPASVIHEVTDEYSVAATVQDDGGDPVVDRDVTFIVISGPHAGLNETIATDSKGKAVLVYTGTTLGTDIVVASFEDSQGNILTSNEAVVEWVLPPNESPVAQCKDVTLTLDSNGQAVLTPFPVDNGSYDPDGDPIIFGLSRTNFTCADIGAQHAVTLTVTDDSNASGSCVANVTVVDSLPPVPDVAPLPQVTGECSATISSPARALDNCAGAVVGTTNDPLSYSEQGEHKVTWTFDDGKGNTSSQTQQVVVADVTPPNVRAQHIIVSLDIHGNRSITAPAIDNGTSDACGIASLTVDPSNFTCSDLGANSVTLTAIDVNGNTSSAAAMVTVEDNVAPIINTNAPETIIPPDAPVSFTASAADNCSAIVEIVDYRCYGFTGNGTEHSKMQSCVVSTSGDTLTIADSGGVGDNIAWTITATDQSGNATTAEGHVLVANPGKSKK